MVASITWGRLRGLRRTPGQLQYDVDVRVVVHRRGAAAARAFFRLDLTLMTKIARGLLDSTNLDRNATVGGLGLVFTRPRAVRSYATYTDTIYRYHISICYRDCRSLAPVPALEPAIH